MFQYQFQTQKPLTTAHLAQTMTLLGMTSAELSQKIDSELANNPALEIIEERRCFSCNRILFDPGPCGICSSPNGKYSEEPIVFISSQADLSITYNNSSSSHTTEELPDDNIAPSEDLSTYILKQIISELKNEDYPIVVHILTSLDKDGFLTVKPIEISSYHHVPISRVERLIRLIQKSDPVGVGSTSIEEALLIQLEVLEENQLAVPPQAKRAIIDGMPFLSRLQYADLAKLLNVDKSEAEGIVHFISTNLNPFPGRAHWGDDNQRFKNENQVYHQPDIIIKKANPKYGNQLMVEILVPLRGTLQINSLFRQAIKNAPEESIEKWKKDLERASLFIKCIQQRNNTMEKLMTFIVKHQQSFILRGEKFLHPITRAMVANELGVHESTISRAVAGKCLQLPSNKIIPLSMFFDRSLPIREQLKDIISAEEYPLTDSQIATILDEKGIKIARRTVAKYRAMEGILPAHMRKNIKKTANVKWSTYSLTKPQTV